MTAEKPEYIRPEVMAFAYVMESTMRAHDKRKGDAYKTSDVDFLLMRLREEVKELHDQVEYEEKNGTLGARKNSFSEAVDVGNISMMLAYRLSPSLEWYLSSSRPAPAPEPICLGELNCHEITRSACSHLEECFQHHEHDAAIRKDEREKVLRGKLEIIDAEIEKFHKPELDTTGTAFLNGLLYARTRIFGSEQESLRTRQQEREQR